MHTHTHTQAAAERDVVLHHLRAAMLPYRAEALQATRATRLALQGRRLELTRLLTRPSVDGGGGGGDMSADVWRLMSNVCCLLYGVWCMEFGLC
jgi:hypothetical protein